MLSRIDINTLRQVAAAGRIPCVRLDLSMGCLKDLARRSLMTIGENHMEPCSLPSASIAWPQTVSFDGLIFKRTARAGRSAIGLPTRFFTCAGREIALDACGFASADGAVWTRAA